MLIYSIFSVIFAKGCEVPLAGSTPAASTIHLTHSFIVASLLHPPLKKQQLNLPQKGPFCIKNKGT